MRHWLRPLLSAALLAVLGACSVNPVTGQRELTLVSSQQEIAIGQEQYVPAQQMQGGTYHADPTLSRYVDQVGQKVARFSGVDLPYEFVVLNNSVPNAWALPGGKIAINRGLLTELSSEAELAAVLGHEVAHAAARHGAKRIERGMLLQGAMVAAAIGSSGSEYAGQILGGAQLAAGLINQKYSRNAEREADYYGTRFMAQAGYDPRGAVTLQETFVRLSGEQRTDWIKGLFASHPPSRERVTNNRQLMQQLRNEGFAQGEMGITSFVEALAPLKSKAQAYEAYDLALIDYRNGDLDGAAREVTRALNMEFNDATFHGLRGAIRLKQKRYQDAITNFDRALARDANFFNYYLGRGLAHKSLNNAARAKQDFNQSVGLLPTAAAYQALGEIAEAEGNRDAAQRYYAEASKAPGEAGRTALVSLARLDLPSNPAKYIQVAVRRDERNRYVLQVYNKAPLAVNNVVVQVELGTAAGVKTISTTIARVGAGETRLSLLQVDPSQVVQARAYPVAAQL